MYSWFKWIMLTIFTWADDTNRMTRGSFKSSWIQSIDIFLKSVKEKSVCLLVHRWLKSFKMTWVSLMMSGCLSQMLSMILVGRVYLKYCLAALWVFFFAVPKKINLRQARPLGWASKRNPQGWIQDFSQGGGGGRDILGAKPFQELGTSLKKKEQNSRKKVQNSR